MKTKMLRVTSYGHRVVSNLVLFMLLFVALHVTRYTLHVTEAQSILPLQVSPARQEIQLDKGEKGAFNVKLFNLTDSPMSGIVKVADFVVTDKDGSPRIIDDIGQSSPRFSASQWVTIPYDRVTIAKNDVLLIQARIKVPQDARPGGRYIAVYFEPTQSLGQPIGQADKEVAMGISPRIASLAFIKVKGPTNENALASQFFAPSFQEYGPIGVASEILNRGDYHIRPRGVITMTNMFDGLVDQSKLDEVNIFPDASREYKNTLGKKWMFGRYKINLVASYGETGKAITSSMYVYVLPWKLILILIIALMLLILITKHLYQNIISKQHDLTNRIEKESDEIERLKAQLNKRDE